jgi:anti-sigma regulatory factor (Ser/Thr protein kinase)
LDRNEDGPEDAHFELTFSPNTRLVGTVRRFVSEFYAQILGDADVTSRLAVATHELLDNAVRYSADGNTSMHIGVRRSGGTVRVTIETRNNAAPANVAAVRVMLDELTAATDALAHYQLLMRRSAKRKDGSGLGLGRVTAESGMVISYDVDDTLIRVRATGNFEARTQP